MTAPTDATGMVERVARGICQARGWNPDTSLGGSAAINTAGYVEMNSYGLMWQNCVPDAIAAIRAMMDASDGATAERMLIATLLYLQKMGVTADTLEMLTHGDGRGTIPVNSLRRALAAALTAALDDAGGR